MYDRGIEPDGAGQAGTQLLGQSWDARRVQGSRKLREDTKRSCAPRGP